MKKCNCKEAKEKLEEIIEWLYRLNASISGNFVTKIRKIEYQDICNINENLGSIIKEFREIIEDM